MDGFIIGGMSRSKLLKVYAQDAKQIQKQKDQLQFRRGSSVTVRDRSMSLSTTAPNRTVLEETTAAAVAAMGSSGGGSAVASSTSNTAAAIDFSKTVNTSLRPAVTGRKSLEQGGMKKDGDMSAAQSFILNEDMRKIRQAELIILKEEEKFGTLMKDPDGRLMPSLQVPQPPLAAHTHAMHRMCVILDFSLFVW